MTCLDYKKALPVFSIKKLDSRKYVVRQNLINKNESPTKKRKEKKKNNA